jgi:hypothetical protein
VRRSIVLPLIGIVVVVAFAREHTDTRAVGMERDDAVAALAEAVPPPERRVWPPSIDWAAFEDRNGFAAPTDYRHLLDRYGVGSFGKGATEHGWLYLHDPFAAGTSLVERSDWDRRNMRGLQLRFPEQYPGWSIWPEVGGLLPWAGTIDGDQVGWWTIGEPDRWGTRFFGRHGEFEEFSEGAASFILGLLTGELEDSMLDEPFASAVEEDGVRFFPATGPQAGDGGASRQEATVSFSGLSPLVDGAALIAVYTEAGVEPLSSEERTRRAQAALDPAVVVIERWSERARAQGVGVRSHGVVGDWSAGQFRHEVSITFLFEAEPTARRLVLELAEGLGIGVAEVRDLEYAPIWNDMTAPG